jgi:hypothetical protein
VRAYFTTVALRNTNEKQAGGLLAVLDEFSRPFNSHDGMTPLVLACGRLVLG